ncbi:MAG: carboxypeptidase regulatory-like domain-containing protein [Oscillibacter sp.]|jgi:LPXTG-motif cell wall-anchored protein|nr:carboxypeptidase regulatory-like domain-containing protein [Oscillibacter sp.]
MKKLYRRSISGLLALLICFTAILGSGMTAYAAAFTGETADSYSVAFPRDGDANLDYSGTWGHDELHYMNGWTSGEATWMTTLHTIGSFDGPACYCIEPGVPRNLYRSYESYGEDYWDTFPAEYNRAIDGRTMKTLLGRIMQYGYQGNLSLDWRSQNKADADKLAHMMATQVLVWETVVGERDADFNHVDPGSADAVKSVYRTSHPLYSRFSAYYDSIEASVKKHTVVPSFMDRSEEAAQTVELSWDGGRYTATLTDTNGVLGEYAFSSAQSDMTFAVDGNDLTISAETASADGVTITAVRNNTRQGVLVWSDGHYGPDGTMQDVVTFRDTVSDPMYAYLHLKVGYGSVKIIKTSEDGEVSGISFTVSGNGTEQTVTTNADGEMQLDDLRPGAYTVTEQSSDRYEPQEVRQVTVISGQVATVTFHNTLKRGSLEVIKTSEDHLIEGVKFHLTGASLSGLPVDEYAVTDSTGKAVFSDVLIGTGYVLSEVDTDVRYVIPEDQTAAVEWSKVTHKSIHNVLKKWNATVTKSDSATGTPQGDAKLSGAVYGVYKGGQLVDTYVTDGNGQFTTVYYACGDDWTIREITPSEGYLLDSTVYPVGAEPQRYTAEYNPIALDVTEQVIRGGVALTKVDKDYPENKLEGAVFEVYRDSNRNQELDAEDELLGTMEELGGGEYALTGLCYGGYFVKEAKAPEGFYLDENAYYFSITTDGETVTVENEAGKGFVNAAQVGSLRIVKTSSDGKLEGFSFRVTGANGYDQVFQTDAEGFILVEGLRIGDYTVSEVRDSSSDGYLLPADKTASVFEGAVTEVEMHNEKKPALEVPQTGDNSHMALWLGLLGISGIGAAAILLMRKHKK